VQVEIINDLTGHSKAQENLQCMEDERGQLTGSQETAQKAIEAAITGLKADSAPLERRYV
jgi:hypothetical protein